MLAAGPDVLCLSLVLPFTCQLSAPCPGILMNVLLADMHKNSGFSTWGHHFWWCCVADSVTSSAANYPLDQF